MAEMLRIQASDPRNPAQFIVTTFHPQIVMVADKVYGISHSNRISRFDRGLVCCVGVVMRRLLCKTSFFRQQCPLHAFVN